MVVAETLAGIALAKSAVSGVKSVINTCQDVNDIAHHLDDLFHGYDQSRHKVNQKKNESKKGSKEWRNYLGKKFHDEEEEVSLSDITAEVIEQKQIEEQMKAMKNMLNKRFGMGTWDEIIELRKQRIEEAKKARERAKQIAEAQIEHQHHVWKEIWKWTWQLSTVVFSILTLWGWLSYASKGKIPWPFW